MTDNPTGAENARVQDDADERAHDKAIDVINAAFSDPSGSILHGHIAIALRQAEQRAMMRERKSLKQWLAKTRIYAAEQNFDVETAIVCSGKGPTLHDAGQAGYAAAIFVWERAVREHLEAIERAAKSEAEG